MKKQLLLLAATACLFALGITTWASEPVFITENYFAGRGPIGAVSADFDSDSNPDVAVVNSVVKLSDKSVAVLFNDSSGTFSYDESEDRYPMSCPKSGKCAGDFDQDGDIDLAVADEDQCWTDGSGNIVILDNDGTGKFTYKEYLPIEGGPRDLKSACLNDDNFPDLVVALVKGDSVAVFINNGDGTFGQPTSYPAGDSAYYVCTAYLDADSDIDIVVANLYSDDVSLLCNNGDGTFEPCGTYSVGDKPMGICCADFDNDTDSDIGVCLFNENNVRILDNLGGGTFVVGDCYSTAVHPHDAVCADIDMDGDIDLAIASWGDGASGPDDSVSILINRGDGTFEPARNFPAGDTPWSICPVDVDSDHDIDFVVANYHGQTVSILRNETPLYAETSMAPEPLYVYWAYLLEPMLDTVRVGNLAGDCSATDIDPFSVTLNGAVSPIGYTLCRGKADFDHPVLELYFPLDQFVWTYPALFDTTTQEYTIQGFLTDGRAFGAEGEIIVIGKNSRSRTGEFLKPSNVVTESLLPKAFVLHQNYPNPFNPQAEISFSLPIDGHVTLDVYNIMGQKVATLKDKHMPAGNHAIRWHGTDDSGQPVTSGVYFYRLQAGEFNETKKMMLLK